MSNFQFSEKKMEKTKKHKSGSLSSKIIYIFKHLIFFKFKNQYIYIIYSFYTLSTLVSIIKSFPDGSISAKDEVEFLP